MRLPIIVAAIVAVLAVAVFAATFARATLYTQSPDELSPPATEASAAGAPIRLRIPALDVDAAVQHVGIAASGNMAVPSNYTDVGWYRGGVVPGELGSAVVDGHVDNGLGAPAVFAHIGTLKAGEEILVDTASGTVRFVVERVQTYLREEVPLELIFNRADRARLNLITCDGVWSEDKKTYDSRLVVYAVHSP